MAGRLTNDEAALISRRERTTALRVQGANSVSSCSFFRPKPLILGTVDDQRTKGLLAAREQTLSDVDQKKQEEKKSIRGGPASARDGYTLLAS